MMVTRWLLSSVFSKHEDVGRRRGSRCERRLIAAWLPPRLRLNGRNGCENPAAGAQRTSLTEVGIKA